MGFRTYAELTRNRAVLRMLVLAAFIRTPMWASSVVVTLHVVTHLHRNYADAGVVSMVLAIALAISSPWRGRALDRIGLRRTVAPSIVVLTVCWSIAPWVSYWPLLGLVAVAGLFTVPSFSIVRQVLIGAVPDAQRTAVLSLDSVAIEITFMIGPVLGVLAATYLGTQTALLVCQLCTCIGGVVLWWDNPGLGSEAAGGDELAERGAAAAAAAMEPALERAIEPAIEPAIEVAPGVVAEAVAEPTAGRLFSWLSPSTALILTIAVFATVVLTGEDLGSVAALRHMHHYTSIGWVLALWGLGSAIGGLVYGALHRHPPAAVMLAGLGATTAAVAFAPGRWEFALLLTISGLFCAPTITATVDELSRLVPPRLRGEAMGWHGSAMTFGSAAGAPLIGGAIDGGGWTAGFVGAGLAGLVVALVGLSWRYTRGRRELEASSGVRVDPQRGEDLVGGPAPVQRVEVQAGSATLE